MTGSDLEREILALLVERGTLDVVDLADAVGEHPVRVDRNCYALQEAGYVRLVGEDRYTVTDAGDRHL